MNNLAAFKDYTTICSSAPSEVLALVALRARQKIIKRNLAIIDKNLSVLDNFFEKHSDIFSWHRPNVGPIAFPKLLLPQKVDEFCAQAVQKQAVMVLPASVYDYSANNFRVGFGRIDFSRALAQFKEFIPEAS